MKKIVILFLALATVLSLTGCGNEVEDKKNADTETSPLYGKKVAYVMQMAPSEIFQMWSASAEETANRLGMEYEAFFCNGSDEQWMETVEQCAGEGYDGLLLSHGGEEYSYGFLTGLMEQYPNLKIATFDTFFEDDEGNSVKIDGVTQFFQQDSRMAEDLLDYICNDLYGEKVEAGEPVNILKVWVGPDYLAAFDRREAGYARYEEEGLIDTVETIGPSDFGDAERSMKEVMAGTLENYQDDEIDAIWCCYDLYAQGVYEALTEAGRDIPMVSVDISGRDMEMMTAENSSWKACATTNWHNNGEFGMRVLALEMTGDYGDIVDPSTGEASDWLEIPVSVITQEMISEKDIDIDSLERVAGDEYSDRSWMPAADWMKEFLGD
ncbi:substrate-binding domain-containing protein [Gallibacter sp. Marseille-QA0791]|uniref:substrate-binding domain-containing protein n=1 Tax=Gallibacter sp. Marseille-QA0791 TaxID=3378781 RepID=UPI003D14CFCB